MGDRCYMEFTFANEEDKEVFLKLFRVDFNPDNDVIPGWFNIDEAEGAMYDEIQKAIRHPQCPPFCYTNSAGDDYSEGMGVFIAGKFDYQITYRGAPFVTFTSNGLDKEDEEEVREFWKVKDEFDLYRKMKGGI